MANDVVINVKVNNKADFSSLKTSLQGLGGVAAQALSSMESGWHSAADGASVLSTTWGNLGKAAETAGGEAAAAGSSIGALAGPLAMAAGYAGIAIGVFSALAPALLAAGGAAAAAATGLAGLGIAGSVLSIGFGGIGAALTAHSKQLHAGGGAAKSAGEDTYQAARRIKSAEENLASAKEREADAAKSVNQARADEVDRLRELDLALRGQVISQGEAAQSLIEAKEKARRANIAGSDWEKAEANNAVKRAQLQYDEVSEKLGDLTEEKKKADKNGVEGSDQVQKALKAQTDAHKATIKAQEDLADAHHKTATAAGGAAGGIDAFGDAMKKLSPNAQKLVYALIDIEKRFEPIKKRVQDRLLSGFAKDVTDLADKWLPHLDDILGGMADHLNGFGHNLMGALGDSEFIKNIEKAGKASGGFIDQMSGAADAAVDAFGRLAAAGAPVLKVIGGFIEKIVTGFDNWIKKADNSGKLQSFMDLAASTLQKIFDIGGLAVKVIGQFIAIIFDDSNAAGQSVLDGLKVTLQKISDWLKDPKHQKDIQDITGKVKDFVEVFMKYFPVVIGWLGKLFVKYREGVDKFNEVKDRTVAALKVIGSYWDWLYNKASSIFGWFGRAGSALSSNLKGAFNGLKDGFRSVINWIIGKWNGLQFTVGGGSFLGQSIPSASFGTPNIPYLASGGIAGGLAMVGERGRELVRLPQGSTVIPNGTTEGMMAGMGGAARLVLGFDARSGSKLMDAIVEGMQNYVHSRGGNVQVALGRHGS